MQSKHWDVKTVFSGNIIVKFGMMIWQVSTGIDLDQVAHDF